MKYIRIFILVLIILAFSCKKKQVIDEKKYNITIKINNGNGNYSYQEDIYVNHILYTGPKYDMTFNSKDTLDFEITSLKSGYVSLYVEILKGDKSLYQNRCECTKIKDRFIIP